MREAHSRMLAPHANLIVEAMQVLHEGRKTEQRRRTRAAIARNAEALWVHPLSPVSGNPAGDVTVIKFLDYRCLRSKRAFEAMADLLESDEKVRVVWKGISILGPLSSLAARAALAADRQGRYHAFHAGLMCVANKPSQEKIFGIAEDVGLNVNLLRQDMERAAIDAYLHETVWLALKLGIWTTPAFVIGNAFVPTGVNARQLQALVAHARYDK